MSRSCGACNKCCELLAIPDIGKPPRMLCWNTSVHGGCAVHHLKKTDPTLAACDGWQCVWLYSQTRPGEEMHPALRPDHSKVVLGPWDKDDSTILYVQVVPDRPEAWKEPLVYDYLRSVTLLGAKVKINIDEICFSFSEVTGIWPEAQVQTDASATD